MKNYIKLQESSILHVPISSYEKDFTFIVNNEQFQTSHFVADLLSPKISKYHQIDPTIQEYSINTVNKGNFSKILNLIKFNEEQINDDEIQFIIEILNDLENTPKIVKMSKNNSNNDTKELSETSFSEKVQNLSQKIKYCHFFEDEINTELDGISSRMYEMKDEDKKIIETFEFEIIEKLIGNSNLSIESEDDLIDFINELYSKDPKYCHLYSYVYFMNISIQKMNEFIEIIDYNDLTYDAWKSISKRLACEIVKTKQCDQENIENRYKKKLKLYKTFLYSNQEFDGIIKYFNNNSNIKDEIDISYSSKHWHSHCSDIWSIFNFDGQKHHFFTKSEESQWICIEFKNHEIKLTDYSVRAGFDSHNPKSFVLEGSNNKEEWTLIDEIKDTEYFKESLSYHTFSIQKDKQQAFKYIRLRLNGKNWHGDLLLQINSIEFYGNLY